MAKAIPSQGTIARIIPFPSSRIIRLRRAPPQITADEAFDAGWRLALDVMARARQKGGAR